MVRLRRERDMLQILNLKKILIKLLTSSYFRPLIINILMKNLKSFRS